MADEEDYEYEEASPEQKINIATYFIMSAPTGEVKEVVNDVKTLVNDNNVLTDRQLSSILHGYNTSQMVRAKSPYNTDVLITPHGEVSDSMYLDPSTGKVLTFDHLTQTITGETDQKQVLADSIAEVRSAIETKLNAFISGFYTEGKVATAVYATDDNEINICISAVSTKLQAYWTGGWRSEYSLNVSDQGQTNMLCQIKTNVHYFEDGNVQLHTEHKKEHKVTVGTAEETALSVVERIDSFEKEWQNGLEEMYVSMHTTTFKAMRRFLPLRGTKMRWDTAQHSVAQEMTQ